MKTGVIHVVLAFVLLSAGCSAEKWFSPNQENSTNLVMASVAFWANARWNYLMYSYTSYLGTNVWAGSGTNWIRTNLEGTSFSSVWINLYHSSSNLAKPVRVMITYPRTNAVLLDSNDSSWMFSSRAVAMPAFSYSFSNRLTVRVTETAGGREVFYGEW